MTWPEEETALMDRAPKLRQLATWCLTPGQESEPEQTDAEDLGEAGSDGGEEPVMVEEEPDETGMMMLEEMVAEAKKLCVMATMW